MQYLNPYIELCIEGSPSIFKGINQKDKEALIQHHSFALIKKNHYLFKEGEKPKGLICIASGKVKVFKEGVGGRAQILRMLRSNCFIGYKALFSDNPWPFSAVAIEDTAVCIFDKSSFVKMLKKNPDLAIRLMKVITDELSSANTRLVSLTQKHIRGRLAESLIILRDTYGYEADGCTIKVALSREDIAHLSNMTTSNAIRTLSNLAAEGIIEVSGRKISIIESHHLEHINEMG